MVSRSKRTLLICLVSTTLFLLTTVWVCRATVGGEKKDGPPQAKVDPKADVDGILEKAFGAGSDEMRRPIRLWIPDSGIAISAQEFSVTRDNRVRLGTFSVAVIRENSAETSLHRGEDALITLDSPITQLSELRERKIATVEVRGNQSSTILTLTPQNKRMIINSELLLFDLSSKEVESKKDGAVNRNVETRFKFTFDPKTPIDVLVPAPAKVSSALPPPLSEDLTKVPELWFGEPSTKPRSKLEAIKDTAQTLAKVNHLNQQKIDGFMEAMIEKRSDLRGLPFLMGQDCRTGEEQARIFASMAERLQQGMRQARNQEQADIAEFLDANIKQGKATVSKTNLEYFYRASVAATTQILMPESPRMRVGLAKYLATVPHVDATKALAKLVLFSAEDEVRTAAIDGLRLRREKDYTDLLLRGFDYPYSPVPRRAADALVKLDRKDVAANLIGVLEQSDPRLPVTKKLDGKEVSLVRELVRVNHNRSCVLCHAPGNTDNVPEGGLTVGVPLPTEPLPKPSDGGYQSVPPPSPDIVVRIDMTYLRQDFSMMIAVNDPHPWPEKQRFDYFVRTRSLTAQEAQAYEPCCADEEPGRLSPYHRAALYALRELTGRDTEPTAAAWRKLLKLPAGGQVNGVGQSLE